MAEVILRGEPEELAAIVGQFVPAAEPFLRAIEAADGSLRLKFKGGRELKVIPEVKPAADGT